MVATWLDWLPVDVARTLHDKIGIERCSLITVKATIFGYNHYKKLDNNTIHHEACFAYRHSKKQTRKYIIV